MLAKPLLALSSYSLLFALLAVRVEVPWIRGACLALAAVGLIGLFLVFGLARRSEPTGHSIKDVQGPGAEASGHLASYLLPFVISPTPTPTDVITYGAFLFVAVLVTARTGAIQVNPLLYVAGWKVIRITDTEGYSTQLVSRGHLAAGDRVWATRLPGDVAVQRKNPHDNQNERS